MFPTSNFFLQRYETWGYPQSEVQLPTVVRINRLKYPVGVPAFDNKIKLKAIKELKDSFIFTADFSPASTPAYLLGHIYVQEIASQLAAIALDPQQTDVVLDMCAAPGSKTTQIASMMNNKGMIVAVDNHTMRVQKLVNNLERCGVTNVIAVRKDAQYVMDLNMEFDRVLLDAPCSGNFAIDKDWFEKRTKSGVQENARLQKDLLQAAIDVTKIGGIIIYSTCSLETEENENIVEPALDSGQVELVDCDLPFSFPGLTERTKKCNRFWPAQSNTQGFFIAKLRKIK
ncbi:MAG TPA: RsmB/NOP family class I SAM-dependent RNA methyltransferase [Acidobacteriota bacterium]|nr:RsmB/NOP family class I SAM-dependent RNA methyltransferase [Acidobacteriota bacterium]